MTGEQKIIVGGAVITVAFIVGAVLFLGGQGEPSGIVDAGQVIGDSGLAAGAASAKVAIVEFADFQCPACGAAHPTVKRVLNDFSDQVAFYYRHFPIVPPHQNAYDAAYAAEAARKQGKFLEVYDWLFENQNRWEEEKVSADYFYEQFGKDLGLEKEKFLQDYQSDETKRRVSQDFSAGRALGVNSTPTFFVNGKKMVGVQSFETFKKEIELATKRIKEFELK